MTQDVGRFGAATLQRHRAGFVSRATAGVIDLVSITLLGMAGLLFIGLLRYLIAGPPWSPPTLSSWLEATGSTVLALAYFTGGWAIAGRTLGMQVLGLRLVDTSGRVPHPARCLVRAVLYLVFPAGLLWVLVSRRNASLQDLVLRTAVVYDWTYSSNVERGSESVPAARLR